MQAGIATGHRMATAALLALLSAMLLGRAFAASVSRTDNSPVCNSYAPACEAQCRQGQEYMFVCSAGNGPNGGPYVLCQCVAPAMPVGPPQQSAFQAYGSNCPVGCSTGFGMHCYCCCHVLFLLLLLLSLLLLRAIMVTILSDLSTPVFTHIINHSFASQ